MEARKIDMNDVRFSLEQINAIFGLVMDDIEQENQGTEEYAELFRNRAENVYIPALDMIQGAICELGKRVEESV